jgi:hypothetical protein
MSLINDALKRATESQPANTPASELNVAMQSIEQRPPARLPMYFTPVLLFIISGACWFLVKGWDARRQAGIYPAPITVHARETAVSSEPESASFSETAAELPIPHGRNFALNDAPTPAASASAPASASIEEPRSAPTFKLQAIFYRPNNPSAVVNSKTVSVGDLVLTGKVKAIDRQSVTIDVGGVIQVLTLQ